MSRLSPLLRAANSSAALSTLPMIALHPSTDLRVLPIFSTGDASSIVPAAQQMGPNLSESAADSEMVQDPAREKNVEMNTTHQDEYRRDDEN